MSVSDETVQQSGLLRGLTGCSSEVQPILSVPDGISVAAMKAWAGQDMGVNLMISAGQVSSSWLHRH